MVYRNSGPRRPSWRWPPTRWRDAVRSSSGPDWSPLTCAAPEQPAELVPARLELPEETSRVLGSSAQTYAVVGSNAVQVWMSRLDALRPGDVVTLAAVTPEGDPILAEAVVPADDSQRIQLELPWPDTEPATAVGIVVRPADTRTT